MYYCGNYNNFDGVISILRQITIGTAITIQYDDQPPTGAIFQGFQNGTVLLTAVAGFPAGSIVRINVKRINAISVP